MEMNKASATTSFNTRENNSDSQQLSAKAFHDESKSLDGTLFIYHEAPFVKRVAFKYGINPNPKNYLISIGGLSDGLMSCNYIPLLSRELEKYSIAVVQILMSSSYNGFGHVRLEDDCSELDALVKFLKEKQRENCKELNNDEKNTLGFIGMLGHSTGCQDCIYHCKNGIEKQEVDCMILQAPVSDREAMEKEWTEAGDQEKIKRFQELKELASNFISEGKGNEMLPRDAFFAPITAYRFQDLSARNGMDDFFSSDFSDEEMLEKFQHINKPTCFMFSGKDEYVPEHVDIDQLGSRWLNTIEEKYRHRVTIPDGTHSLKGNEQEMVKEVKAFLMKFGFI